MKLLPILAATFVRTLSAVLLASTLKSKIFRLGSAISSTATALMASFAITLFWGTAASATPIDQAILYAEAGPETIHTAGTVSYNFCNGLLACSNSSATVSYGLDEPSLSVSAGSAPMGNYEGAQAQINFYFAVIGPNPSTHVPLELTASASTSVSANGGGAVGYEYATIFVGGGYTFKACSQIDNPTACGSSPQSFSGTYSLGSVLADGGEFQAVYYGSAAVTPGAATNDTLDPSIFIDPIWLAQNPGYSLTFSPAVVAAPEPLSLSLFGTGLIGAMAFRRRKRQSS